MRTDKLSMNKRFKNHLRLLDIVNKKYQRRTYITSLDLTIYNLLTTNEYENKSIYINTFQTFR